MLLATYQIADWETYRNTRNGRVKRLLGIPETSNIYWCFAANNMYQAVINSFLVEPNAPFKIIFFETNDYFMIDKIKWDRYVEMESMDKNSDRNADLDIDLLNVLHPDTAEFIVAEIPENRLEVDLQRMKDVVEFIGNRLDNDVTTDTNRHIAYVHNIANLVHIYDSLIDDYVDLYTNSAAFDHFLQDDMMRKQYQLTHALKAAFETSELLLIYAVFSDFLCGRELNFNTLRWNILEKSVYIGLQNRYTLWINDIVKLSDEDAYDKLTALRKDIFVNYFIPERKIGPNAPCPCGSGKKYKKCCRDGLNIDIPMLLSEGIS